MIENNQQTTLIQNHNRPKIAKSNYNDNNQSDEFSLKNIEESICLEKSSVSSRESNSKDSDLVLNKKGKETYQRFIQNESNRFELINKHKVNLREMNLIENEIEGLYDWHTLFNKSRPISSYTQINQSSNLINKSDLNQFRFPVALIDASEKDVAQYIPGIIEQESINQCSIVSKNIKRPLSECNRQLKTQLPETYTIRPRQGNAIRPQSMYSTRAKTDVFYLSKAFSDYYTEDLRVFSQKVPLVKPKLKVKKKKRKLNTTIKTLRSQAIKKENKYNKLINKELILLSPMLLNIAGNLNNCEPLLKSIHSQTNHNKEDDIDKKIKLYPKTAKPLGSVNEIVDYTVNNRNAHIEEIKSLRDNYSTKGRNGHVNSNSHRNLKCLSLPTYEENDPQLKIFKQIEAKLMKPDLAKEDKQEEEEHHHHHQQQQQCQPHQVEEKTTMTIQSTLMKTRNKNRPKRPSTSHQYSTSNILENKRLLRGNKRCQSSFNHLNNIQSQISYHNLNSSSSMINTCASLTCFDYAPKQSMPIRTVSVINNPTYRRIDRNMKDKQKEIDNAFIIDLPHSHQHDPFLLEKNNKMNQIVQTEMHRPKSSLVTHNRIKSNNFDKRNSKIDRQRSLKSNLGVKLIYFNDYIDTNFIGKGNNKMNEDEYDIELTNYVNSDQYKRNHKINYFPVNCFNKGTCIKTIGSKRIALAIENGNKNEKLSHNIYNNINDYNNKRRISWKIKNCK